MRTTLSPEALATLHTQGRAKVGAFVNPATIVRCKAILLDRGEDWAASVLMVPGFARRSPVNVRFPWLSEGDEEILVLADEAEWDQLDNEVRS